MEPNRTYNKLIKDADVFFNVAMKEYKKGISALTNGKKEKGDKIIRQAAEKAWNAAVQAVKALAVSNGKKIPRNFNAQKIFLIDMEKNNGTLNGYPFYAVFKGFASQLHGECFYHGEYQPDEHDFKDVKRFINEIKKCCNRHN
jgi:hypothetical protein